jgi:hypothetical protein
MLVRGDLPTTSILWQPRAGAWIATVVTKLTLRVEPGLMVVERDSEPIVETDSFWNDDPERSLVAPCDLVPAKSRVDVLLYGHAFAPAGTTVRSLRARLSVGSIDKSIELVSDRTMMPDGNLQHGAAFSRMPIVWERAASGPSLANPVGVRSGSRDGYGRSMLPNLVPVGRGDDPSCNEPIGLGPLAPTWPTRRDLLGKHAASFVSYAWSSKPLPDGFDMSFFNAAPRDQQLAQLDDDATIVLENLHPMHPVLETALPGLRPQVVRHRRGQPEPLRMRLDTLTFDTDRALATLTWRGAIALERPDEPIELSVEIIGSKGNPRETSVLGHATVSDESQMPAPVIPSVSKPDREERTRATTINAILSRESSAALPFAGSSASPSAPRGSKLDALPFAGQAPPIGPAVPPAVGITMPSRPMPGSPSASSPPAFSGSYPPAPAPAVPQPIAAAPFTAAASVPSPVVSAAFPTTAATAAASSTSPWAAGPSKVVGHSAAAVLAGVVGASNAAAEPRVVGEAQGPAARRIEGDVLQLLWFQPELSPRVRRKPEWKKLLDELEQARFDPDIDEPAAAEDPAELEDRREVFEVLARGRSTEQAGVERAMLDAIRPDGRFAPQLLLVAGELRFDFDELEQLKTMHSIASSFAATDEELKKALEPVGAYLSTPGLVPNADVANSFTTRVREAFARSSRTVGPTYLDEQAERSLLERRAFQKRAVFGAPHLRAELLFAGASSGVPTYLPEALAPKLPLFRRLRSKCLVETHFQADQYEVHDAAFKAMAVARVVR